MFLEYKKLRFTSILNSPTPKKGIKMLNNKKIIAALTLVLSLNAAILSSCTGNGDENNTSDTSDMIVTEQVTEHETKRENESTTSQSGNHGTEKRTESKTEKRTESLSDVISEITSTKKEDKTNTEDTTDMETSNNGGNTAEKGKSRMIVPRAGK